MNTLDIINMHATWRTVGEGGLTSVQCASDRPRLYRMTSCCGLTPLATINSLPDIFAYICETIKYTKHNWHAARNPSENKRGRQLYKIPAGQRGECVTGVVSAVSP